MKKQALAIAVATALAAPSAFAAQDTSGMRYTSAAEGFYASIRARFVTAKTENAGADIENGSSRIGVRGTNDLGGGLEGFYRLELGVGLANSSAVNVRMGHVGLRGQFGEVWMGTNWGADYNWTHGSTDIANTHSGNLNYAANDGLRPGRVSKSLQYTTPDLNGFQAAVRGTFDSANDGEGAITDDETEGGNTNPKDDADLDAWNLSAIYAIHGFTVAGSYNVEPDGRTVGNDKEDAVGWTGRLGYAQDNWYVTGWYGENNNSDQGDADDTTLFSLAGGVAVGKVNVYALYEQSTSNAGGTASDVENAYSTVGVQYNLGANSRVWIEYAGRDLDTNDAADDYVNIGLRHDF